MSTVTHSVTQMKRGGMGILRSLLTVQPLSSAQLHKMAEEFRLPKRLLSEAQEVLLFHGHTPRDAAEILRRHCVLVRDEGSGVAGFRRLLDATIASCRIKR